MSVLFDYTQQYSFSQGAAQTTPTNYEFWRDVFNPGHTGTNLVLQARLIADLFAVSEMCDWSWKLQYALIASPTSWVDLLTGSGTYEYPTAAVSDLAADLTDVATEMQVDTYIGYSTGYVKIDDEIITYTGTAGTPNRLTGLTRGVLGTSAAAHSNGDPVDELTVTGDDLAVNEQDFIETSIALPILLRLIGSADAGTLQLKTAASSLLLRMIGTVS